MLLDVDAEEHNAATVVEWALVDRMVAAQWRLDGLERAEAAQAKLDRNRFQFEQKAENGNDTVAGFLSFGCRKRQAKL